MNELNKGENGRVDFKTFTIWFRGGCPDEISRGGEKYCTEEGFPTLLSYWYYINRLLIFDISFLQEDWKPTIDFNMFIMLMPLSLAQMALAPVLKVPTFLWSLVVSPSILFALWYDKVYGAVTRLLLAKIWEVILNILGLILVVIMFIFTNTLEAAHIAWYFVWTAAWRAFFQIVDAVWSGFVGIFPITWQYTLEAFEFIYYETLYWAEFIFLALPWYIL